MKEIEVDSYIGGKAVCPTCNTVLYGLDGSSDLHFCEHVLFVVHEDGFEHLHKAYDSYADRSLIESAFETWRDPRYVAEDLIKIVSEGVLITIGANDPFDSPAYIGLDVLSEVVADN